MEVEEAVKIAATQMFRVHRKVSPVYPVAMFLTLHDAIEWKTAENEKLGREEYIIFNRLD